MDKCWVLLLIVDVYFRDIPVKENDNSVTKLLTAPVKISEDAKN